MTDIIGWLALYAGGVTLVIAAAHRREVTEHAARDSETDADWREVESVPVHEKVGGR